MNGLNVFNVSCNRKMMVAGLYIFLILNLFIKWGKNQKKIICFVLTAACIIFFAENVYSFDQQVYYSTYSLGTYYYFEFLYRIICMVLSKIGLDYIQFKYVIGVCEAILLFARFKTAQIPNVHMVISLWMLSSFMIETEQSRFYFAMVIVIYATKYLECLTIKSNIKYIVLIIVASQIHTATFVFLLLLLCKIKKTIYIQYLAGLACIITAISVLFGNNWGWLGELIYVMTSNERILYWLKHSTHWGFLGPVLLQFTCFCLLWGGKIYVISKRKKHIKKEHYIFFKTIYNLSIILFIVVPLYTISTAFIRLLRGCMILIFSAFAIVLYYAKKQEKVIYVCGVVIFIVMFNLFTYNAVSPLQWNYYKDVYQHLLYK